MRTAIFGFFGLIAACAPQYTESLLQPGAAPPVSEARFTAPPELLYTAFREACDGPQDQYADLRGDAARCRLTPPPDVAAALLLRFDSALELPYFFVERRTRSDGNAYVVSFSYFATVPLKSGNDQRVYLRSNDLDSTIEELFRAFGGEPI